jgi:hypothetical protein
VGKDALGVGYSTVPASPFNCRESTYCDRISIDHTTQRLSLTEPCGLDVVLVIQLEQAIDAYGSAVDATANVGRVLHLAIGGVDPIGDGINVDLIDVSVSPRHLRSPRD